MGMGGVEGRAREGRGEGQTARWGRIERTQPRRHLHFIASPGDAAERLRS